MLLHKFCIFMQKYEKDECGKLSEEWYFHKILTWVISASNQNIPAELGLYAAEALTHYISRSQAAMLLTMQDKQVIVFHGKGPQIPVCLRIEK